jgi:hypothetical protein
LNLNATANATAAIVANKNLKGNIKKNEFSFNNILEGGVKNKFTEDE